MKPLQAFHGLGVSLTVINWLKFLLVGSLVCVGLPACLNQKSLPELFVSKGDDAMGRKIIDALRTADYETATKMLDPKIRDDKTAESLKKLHKFLDHGTPLEVTIIGVWSQDFFGVKDVSRRATLTYQIHFSGSWAVVTVYLARRSGPDYVSGINVQPVRNSLEVLNRFQLFGKTPVHYLFLMMAVAVPLFTLLVVWICIRSPIRRKWLWIIVVMFGGGVFRLDWTSGQHDYQALSILLFGAAMFRASIYSPWVISVATPAGAILFLVFRRRLMVPPEPVSMPPPLPAVPQEQTNGNLDTAS